MRRRLVVFFRRKGEGKRGERGGKEKRASKGPSRGGAERERKGEKRSKERRKEKKKRLSPGSPGVSLPLIRRTGKGGKGFWEKRGGGGGKDEKDRRDPQWPRTLEWILKKKERRKGKSFKGGGKKTQGFCGAYA